MPVPKWKNVRVPLLVTGIDTEAGDLVRNPEGYAVRFAGGQRSQTFPVSTNRDADGDDERFTVALDTANLPPEVTAGSASPVEFTIDDDAEAEVTLSVSPERVREGETVTVTATLSKPLRRLGSNRDIHVGLRKEPGTTECEPDPAGSGGRKCDFTGVNFISIPFGRTSGSTEIRTYRDADDDHETFTVALSRLNSRLVLAADSPSSVEVTIIDGDVPPEALPGVVLLWGSIGEVAGVMPFELQLAAPLDHAVSVDYATAEVSEEYAATLTCGYPSQDRRPGKPCRPATAGEDYTPVEGTFVFEPGETRKRLLVPVVDDTVEDSGEIVRLVLSNPQGVSLSRTWMDGVILNREDGSEDPDDGTVTVELPRVNPHAALIAKVREWRNDPRWVAHRAHTDRWDRVLLALGETVADGSLTAMTAAEAQVFADRGWSRWVEVAAALKEIEDGGAKPPAATPPAVTIAAGGAVTEGAGAVFTLTASPAPSADLAVTVSVSQSGAFAEAAALGARTVTIGAGETTAAFTVATVGDGTDEPDGAVVAAVQAGSGYTVGGTANATVAVADDDAPAPAVTIAGGAGVTEGAGAVFTLTASPAPAADLAVTVSVSQSGAFAEAAALGARTVTVAAGETTAAFTVATVGDGTDEPDGAVVAAVQAGAGYTVGGTASATVAVADDDEPAPAVTIAGGPAVTEGAGAVFTLTASPAPSADLSVSVSVSQRGAFADASALGARTVTVAAGETTAAFTVATVGDSTDEPDGAIVAAVQAGAGYTVGGTANATVAVADDDEALPAIAAERSIAREGRDDAMVFTVTLSHAAREEVSVAWTTADGRGPWAGAQPATAGADYKADSGKLTFAAGATRGTVSVPIFDDAIDEGGEYFLVRFSNPQGATLATRETRGLIWNDDHLQSMWLSRFGRTVGSQVTDAVSERLEGGLAPGAHATLAGQSVDLSKADDGKALAEVLTGLARTFGAPGAPAAEESDPFARHGVGGSWNAPAASSPARSVTGRELLLGSAFHVAPEGDGSGPGLAAWGRVAQGSFDGTHADDTGSTGVDGEVVTGTLGADADWGRLLAGVAVSFSDGEGAFDAPEADVGKKGRIESTMTTVSPYARFRVTERVSAWGLAGWGTGAMTIRFDDGSMDPVRTDLSMQLGALGARGELLTPAEAGGLRRSRSRPTRSGCARNRTRAANSVAQSADASRVRTGAGRLARPSRSRARRRCAHRWSSGCATTAATPRPARASSSAAASLRRRGLGALGASRRRRGCSSAHADSDYEEWGASAGGAARPRRARARAVVLAQRRPSARRRARLRSGCGAAHDARGLAPDGERSSRRRGASTAEAGYGMALFGDRFTGTPNARLRACRTAARDYRLGWRLTSAVEGDPGFEVNLDATRREAANDNAAEHGIMLRSLIRW